MNIHHLLEAGKPVYNSDYDVGQVHANRRTITDAIERMGAGTALKAVLSDPAKLIYRGLRGQAETVFMQDTDASVRRSQNTENYVTLLSECLPSWQRASVPPRSKIVACSSSVMKARSYGELFVVLPTDQSTATYVQSHDFWSAFDGANHLYNSDSGIPFINDAIGQYARSRINTHGERGEAYVARSRDPNALIEMLKLLEQDLIDGTLSKADLNPDMEKLLSFDQSTNNVFAILDTMLDPSFMKTAVNGKLIKPGSYEQLGEEIAVGGKIVYVRASIFDQVFGMV